MAVAPDADGSFRLAARHSGEVLDSPGGSAQGTQLVQWQDTGGDSRRWKLVDAGGAYYVIQRPAGSGTNQQWQLDAL
ncbi:RICIN domain-containing protein [Streptomyces coeruleorubidus]|nr:RICIN domain-containing protein [Streptomyces coeruleorubidus]WDV56663.1 RICIN domain-containing protein [Streptomyces coeruleorubidus]